MKIGDLAVSHTLKKYVNQLEQVVFHNERA